jgi:hypothetical protein
MRRLFTAALFLAVALPLGAQEDPAARRDFEQGPAARPAASRAEAHPPLLTRRRTVLASLGVVGPGTWFEMSDGAGVTMRTGVGIRAGAEVTWPSFQRADVVLLGRVAGASPSAKDRELAGDPSAVITGDALVGIDWLFGMRARLRTAAGATWVHGPSNVDPWASDSDLAPAAEVSIATRLRWDSRWWLALGGSVIRYSGVSADRLLLGSPGAVVRPWLEVRRAF